MRFSVYVFLLASVVASQGIPVPFGGPPADLYEENTAAIDALRSGVDGDPGGNAPPLF